MDGQILKDLWLFNGYTLNQPYIPFLNLFLAAGKYQNVPQIIAVAQLLICHVQIYDVAPIVRIRSLMMMMMMMMILVNIKMKALMEKQMTPLIVVKTNYLKMMK